MSLTDSEKRKRVTSLLFMLLFMLHPSCCCYSEPPGMSLWANAASKLSGWQQMCVGRMLSSTHRGLQTLSAVTLHHSSFQEMVEKTVYVVLKANLLEPSSLTVVCEIKRGISVKSLGFAVAVFGVGRSFSLFNWAQKRRKSSKLL